MDQWRDGSSEGSVTCRSVSRPIIGKPGEYESYLSSMRRNDSSHTDAFRSTKGVRRAKFFKVSSDFVHVTVAWTTPCSTEQNGCFHSGQRSVAS